MKLPSSEITNLSHPARGDGIRLKQVIREIKATIESSQSALSPKGIAQYAKIDADTAELNRIQDVCFEAVSEGILVAIDRREDMQGALFFDIKR